MWNERGKPSALGHPSALVLGLPDGYWALSSHASRLGPGEPAMLVEAAAICVRLNTCRQPRQRPS
jgi:hypothetical protein